MRLLRPPRYISPRARCRRLRRVRHGRQQRRRGRSCTQVRQQWRQLGPGVQWCVEGAGDGVVVAARGGGDGVTVASVVAAAAMFTVAFVFLLLVAATAATAL